MLSTLRAQQSQLESESTKLPCSAPSPFITYKTADTTDELEQSYRLLHDTYVEQGYMFPDPSGLRVSIYNALPSTRTFVAMSGERVVSCLTLIPDSPLGLPMDEIYQQELDALRKSRRKIAEVSGFVSDRSSTRTGITISLNLFKCLCAQALADRTNDLCIAVNPSHKRFYENVIGFRMFGGLKTYSSVNYAPAYALRLEDKDFYARATSHDNRVYRLLAQECGKRLEDLRPDFGPVMSEMMLHYFFCRKTNILPEASRDVLDLLSRQYPRYDFVNILGRPR